MSFAESWPRIIVCNIRRVVAAKYIPSFPRFKNEIQFVCELAIGKQGTMDESRQLKTMKILVVHRQKKTVDQIKLVLSSCNPVVIYAESGLDGLLTSRIEHFDVIFCSTNLPVVTGFELVRSIRNNSVNRDTAVILLSEEVNELTQHLGKSLGILATLTINEIDTLLFDIIEACVKTESDKSWNKLRKDHVKSDFLINKSDWKQGSLEHSGPSLLPQA